MEAGGPPAATPEPGAVESTPEHGTAPAADLFPFSSAAPAVVVVTVEAPAGAEEVAAPGGKPPVVFSPSSKQGGKSVATFVAKHVEVRFLAALRRSCFVAASRCARTSCASAVAAAARGVGTRRDLC